MAICGYCNHPGYHIQFLPLGVAPSQLCGLYVNLTQDHCDGLIRDHLGEEVVAQASS